MGGVSYETIKSALRKCPAKVIGTKAGGLSEIRKCGKPGTVQRGKQWFCPAHDPQAPKRGGAHARAA